MMELVLTILETHLINGGQGLRRQRRLGAKELRPRMENVVEEARGGRERELKSAVPGGTR
jgi:hypothetical protein